MSDLSSAIGGAGLERVTVMQGEAHASADRNLELSTVLGSCVATCLFDPVARIGGMNHFLLAEPPSTRSRSPGATTLKHLLSPSVRQLPKCSTPFRKRIAF